MVMQLIKSAWGVMVNIAFLGIAGPTWLSGATESAFDRLRLLQERDHKVAFLCAGDGSEGTYRGIRVLYLKNLPAPLVHSKTNSQNDKPSHDRTFQILAELRHRLACFRPEIIDVQNGHRATPAMARAALQYGSRVRAVVSPHSFDIKVENHGTWSVGWDGVLFNSGHAHSLIQRRARLTSPSEVVHSGVDSTVFRYEGLTLGAIDAVQGVPILHLGRFHPDKGHRWMVEAMPGILQAIPSARLIVCEPSGLASKMPEVQRYVTEVTQLAGSLQVHRFVHSVQIRPSDVPAALRSVRARGGALVAPTVNVEAFGRTPVEAHLLGVVPIGTNEGGHVETIRHGIDGFLVERNNVTQLVDAITAVLCDDGLREKMAKAGRDNTDRFDSRKLIIKLEDFYREVLEKPRILEPFEVLPIETSFWLSDGQHEQRHDQGGLVGIGRYRALAAAILRAAHQQRHQCPGEEAEYVGQVGDRSRWGDRVAGGVGPLQQEPQA
jgi:glycosyltransferase involved in cell wall biosynthesis